MRALRFVYLLAGLFLIGAAGFAAYVSSRSLVEARASASWPSVPGRVTSSRSVMIVGRHGSSGPDVRYTYAVGTNRFSGSRLEVVTYSSNTSYASDAVAAFQEGSDVPVYYDPAHPERSVLRRGANWVAYGLPVLCAVMILFGVALVRLSAHLGRVQSAG
jgi:hypothetical protein